MVGVTQKMPVKKGLAATANVQPDSAHPTGLPISPKVYPACRGCRACRARQLPTGQLKGIQIGKGTATTTQKKHARLYCELLKDKTM